MPKNTTPPITPPVLESSPRDGTRSGLTTQGKVSRIEIESGRGTYLSESLDDATLQGAIENGVEKIGPYDIYGSKGMIGDTYTRNIFLLETTTDKTTELQFRQLLQHFESEALGAGASRLSIYGSTIQNDNFLSPMLAQRFGYSFQQAQGGAFFIKTF